MLMDMKQNKVVICEQIGDLSREIETKQKLKKAKNENFRPKKCI